MKYEYLRLLGKKWTVSILLELEKYQVMRFNQLKNNLGKISSVTLSSILKELKAHNLVKSFFLDDYLTPSYSLTDLGSSIIQEVIKSNVPDFSTKVRVIKLDKNTEQKVKEIQKSHFKRNNGESIDFSTVIESLIKKGIDKTNFKKFAIGSASFAGIAALCLDHSLEILTFCESIH
ncbi:MAG: hypothetical protein GWN01_15975 [Nitrosopumilaceae archaeon]|nr:helix-turn-helix transcriptional regulator [Nitrosopumilaceae archaeon]NIU02335.1 helix-turn-helix transcriptional regulator [Nitrosopumilaceae archaeon]NIU88790.1 hypothetical protein [Nitrosopumilaceae archaeon]NIV66917.1 hypothetical protein [Nitrosopumilaceae archaeon]NIX62936.1 hypothetical protein [Nitrosopumilaceae archaeon]